MSSQPLLLKFMAGSYNDRITLPLPPDRDYTGITVGEISYQKPNGTTGTWVATVDADERTVYYDTASGDLDDVGVWTITPIAGERGGLPHVMEVY